MLLNITNSLEPMRARKISHVNLCQYEAIQKTQAKSHTLLISINFYLFKWVLGEFLMTLTCDNFLRNLAEI